MKPLLTVFLLVLVAACSDNGNDGADPVTQAPTPPPEPTQPEPVVTAAFEVVMTNLTVAQPLSPPIAVLHREGSHLYQLGESASAALEVLAEGGDGSDVLTEAAGAAQAAASAPVGPGGTEVLTLELPSDALPGLRLSTATMLVNTNDAFTGLDALDVASLAVGESMTHNGIAYDAGTEANTEMASTIPGPAGGGEGFNAQRDDRLDRVTVHGGVVTANDGLASSDLDQRHRWDNPVVRFTITRTR